MEAVSSGWKIYSPEDNDAVGGDDDDDDDNNAIGGERLDGEENDANSGWFCTWRMVMTTSNSGDHDNDDIGKDCFHNENKMMTQDDSVRDDGNGDK